MEEKDFEYHEERRRLWCKYALKIAYVSLFIGFFNIILNIVIKPSVFNILKSLLLFTLSFISVKIAERASA